METQTVYVHVEELRSGSLSLMAASAGALWRRDSIFTACACVLDMALLLRCVAGEVARRSHNNHADTVL